MAQVKFLADVSPLQDHLLKRFLVEACLKEELHELSEPGCLGNLGPPFQTDKDIPPVELPMLKYFFSQFVASFPFIANNSKEDQVAFWNETVRPFIDSINAKRLSNSSDRKENVTKRKQINTRLLRTLLIFFNSMLSSKKELEYLSKDHLKPSGQGKLDKLALTEVLQTRGLGSMYRPHGLHEYAKVDYVNNINVDIIAVEVVRNPQATELWFILNPFKLTKNFKLRYSYVLQFTERNRADSGMTTYKSHFISKQYSDFEKLESALKRTFPGLMTSLNRLPRNIKNDNGVRRKTKPNLDPESLDGQDDSLEVSLTRDETYKFYREKHRLALRGYLGNLVAVPEIAHCSVFQEFIAAPSDTFHDLNAKQLLDYNERILLEKNRLATQEEFQNKIAAVVYHLSKSIEQFKAQIVLQPRLLYTVFEEIGTCQLMDDLSPLLKTFVDWCKLEVAATLYQIFLTQANSSEWFYKCRKFHRLFPYKVCYGILKYTNPVSIISRIVDLLLMDLPSFGRKKDNQVNNLLSMTFIMLLDEDLEDYLKEREKLLNEEPLNLPKYDFFKDRIVFFVNSLDYDLQEDVKEESIRNGTDYLLEILSSPLVQPVLTAAEQATFDNLIKPSYEAYSSLEASKKLDGTSVYTSLKQLWQLDVRTRDKNVLKQLWREPELTKLIKKFLAVFYQPLMKVMKQCDVHLVFLDFQRFLDDLVAELTSLDEGEMYFTSSVEMFNRFKILLDKHEQGFWRFLRDLYLKDDSQLFMNLIVWIESFLAGLRKKFEDPEAVEIEFSRMHPTSDVDQEKFMAELDELINGIMEKRAILKDYLEESAALNSGSESSSSTPAKQEEKYLSAQKAISKKWKDLNSTVFNVLAQDLGISKAEFVELSFAPSDKESKDNRTEKVLRKIAELNAASKKELDPEIQKLVRPTHERIREILSKKFKD